MTLPVEPPVEPMLARLEDAIPEGPGWLYEPKWDGFRAIVFRDGSRIHIGSRRRQPLERYFPELVRAIDDELPQRCVVDGEIVIAGPSGLDFEALLLRIHPAASRINALAREAPSRFVAFDVLALEDDDLRAERFVVRRAALERMLEGATQAFVTPQTADPEEAARWFDRFEGAGLDGVVAKREDVPYLPGERVMVKVKHERTADCVVGGYRLSKSGDGVGSLLLGLYDRAGILHNVGATSAFSAGERRELLTLLRPLEGGTSFVGGRSPGGPSRWRQGVDTAWVSLEPELVCEVAFDHLQGDRFRHLTRFLRWRPDKDPRECTYDQLAPPRPFSLDEVVRLGRRR